MLNYIARQLNLLWVTLLMLSLLSFSLIYLFPGDPLTNLSGLQTQQLSAEEVEQLKNSYHLDDSYIFQYWQYLQQIFSGNWGVSFSSGEPLFSAITQALPASIELSLYGLFLSLFLGIPLGLMAGLKHRKITDHSLLTISAFGQSVPVFWLALLLIIVFCLQLNWLPLSGRISLIYDVPYQTGFLFLDIWLSDIADKTSATQNALLHLILPTASIAAVTCSVFLRIVRRSTLETMPKDFIKAAFTRGLTQRQVFIRHGMRNALIPILPLLVPQFAALLTNTMIVEIIFSWPGLGNWLIQAIYQRDYPAIRVGMLVVSTLVVLFTVATDIFIRSLDPALSRKRHVAI